MRLFLFDWCDNCRLPPLCLRTAFLNIPVGVGLDERKTTRFEMDYGVRKGGLETEGTVVHAPIRRAQMPGGRYTAL